MSAYGALHTAIVAGELSPGERLVEEELAERLGVSRGAVREAILRLGHDGLVVRERNRGARVRRFTLDEAIEILEARAALESLAAGYAALRRTEDEARELEALANEMRALHADGELLAMSERNAVMHRRILEVSAHRVSRDICARLNSQMVRFQFRTVLAPGRSDRSMAEHQRIVEAISAGDRLGAEAAMREHLTNVSAALVEIAAPDLIRA
ncbi:GntR family transcriptional regulator [Solirubrobacter phytolaccae]|uniref:GntR family transcriptional regulator n=1 Tax=Solirubrobacter phytolaccae TaxID=1404360 RepID=A0A9X3NAQ2_9ACTN|nr:GntR family transcriptional regulator [Solirubrobacter phytolaccae]MDA0182918.1 GntR family transcriptional regulator [Solirubrobacter phytolaccae]